MIASSEAEAEQQETTEETREGEWDVVKAKTRIDEQMWRKRGRRVVRCNC